MSRYTTYLKALINRLGVGRVARVCINLKNAWRARLSQREQTVFYNAEGKHCSNSARPNGGSEKNGEEESWACDSSLRGDSSPCPRWESWKRYEPQEPICWVLFNRQKPRVFGWMEMNWLQRNRALSLSYFLFKARQAQSRAVKVRTNPREWPRKDSIISASLVCENANTLEEVNIADFKGLNMTHTTYLLYQSLTEWWAL